MSMISFKESMTLKYLGDTINATNAIHAMEFIYRESFYLRNCVVNLSIYITYGCIYLP